MTLSPQQFDKPYHRKAHPDELGGSARVQFAGRLAGLGEGHIVHFDASRDHPYTVELHGKDSITDRVGAKAEQLHTVSPTRDEMSRAEPWDEQFRLRGKGSPLVTVSSGRYNPSEDTVHVWQETGSDPIEKWVPRTKIVSTGPRRK